MSPGAPPGPGVGSNYDPAVVDGFGDRFEDPIALVADHERA